ncbi:MAG: hypothetical protein AAF766_13330 [Cyanobacteria bacterium P01_D01_bin.14]
MELSDNVASNTNADFEVYNGTGNPANFELADLANVTANNTGTFDPADPAGSGDFSNDPSCP